MAVLRAKDLNLAQLQALLQNFGKGRIWIDAPDGWSFSHWQGLEYAIPWCGAGREPIELLASDAITRSNAGRIFNYFGELKWRKISVLGAAFWRTVFLGEDRQFVEVLEIRNELNGLTHSQAEYPLWGILTETPYRNEQTLHEWVELRIPHRFRYPVQLPSQPQSGLAVKVVVEKWKDGCGETHFMRLCDLMTYSGGE